MVFLKCTKGKFSTHKSLSKSESFEKTRHQKSQSKSNLGSGIREDSFNFHRGKHLFSFHDNDKLKQSNSIEIEELLLIALFYFVSINTM